MSSSVFSSRRFGCEVFANLANIALSPSAHTEDTVGSMPQEAAKRFERRPIWERYRTFLLVRAPQDTFEPGRKP